MNNLDSPTSQCHNLSPDRELDLLPPPSLSLPLWRSLLIEVMDRLSPEKLPPLYLTCKPLDVGMLLGDLVDLPWYRTVFSNIGDVVAPETLPPLQLESRPVDVGELIGDQLDHGWWTSLLETLRDKIGSHRVPPLRLTSTPVNPDGLQGWLQLPSWSSVIEGPKVFLPDVQPAVRAASPPDAPVESAPPSPAPIDPQLVLLERQLRHDLRRARLREALWISILAAEVVYLVVGFVGPK